MRRFKGDPVSPLRREIERLLSKHGVTASQVERAAPLSVGHLQGFLSGNIRTPDIVTACVLARALTDGDLNALVPVDEICDLYDREVEPPAALRRRVPKPRSAR